MTTPPVVSPQEWEDARLKLLVREKEVTRARDALAAERRRMPWTLVEKRYEFEGPRRQGAPPRPVRRAAAAGRPPRVLRAGHGRGWAGDAGYTITDDFDADFGVDEWHGTNAFVRDGDRIFRTYFVNNRGDEAIGSTRSYLDITALGRQEEWEDSPDGYPQTPPCRWWRHHDTDTRTA